MKALYASEAAKRALRALPEEVAADFLKAINNIRNGRPSGMQFKPLNNLGKNVKGVIELVINGSPAFRAVYVAKFNNAVYLLHAFTKTTNGVDKKAMDLVVKRYKEIPK